MKPFYLIDNVEDIFVFLHSEARNAQITFFRESTEKRSWFSKHVFMGTLVNRIYPYQ